MFRFQCVFLCYCTVVLNLLCSSVIIMFIKLDFLIFEIKNDGAVCCDEARAVLLESVSIGC